MSGLSKHVGPSVKLQKKLFKALAVATLATTMLFGDGIVNRDSVNASGETRTISLFHIHTKESLTVTYMQNGRYVPSAMKKINYLLRDWRRDQTIAIDPRTVDLIWEMHEDLGSQSDIRIVCGYRSKQTNAFLKRIGRNVAKHSQHSEGKAIDFYFPDVPTVKIRNIALYRKVGGVGYYRSAGGPTGFLHVDSAHVRHWGPRISNSQMASALSEGRKYSGRRLSQGGSDWAVASAGKPSSSGGLLAFLTGKLKGKQPDVQVQSAPEIQQASYADTNYSNGSAGLANLSAAASAVPQPKAAPAQVAETSADADMADIKKGIPVPVPRQKPLAILAMAAANIRIIPVSDEPTDQRVLATGQLTKKILEAELTTASNAPDIGTTNASGKTNFAGAPASQVPAMRLASSSPFSSEELALWKSLVSMNAATLRHVKEMPPITVVAEAEERPQEINRSGKGSLPRQTYKLIDLVNQP
jgi:uncharacterized protein YcbK (DUF882 family)